MKLILHRIYFRKLVWKQINVDPWVSCTYPYMGNIKPWNRGCTQSSEMLILKKKNNFWKVVRLDLLQDKKVNVENQIKS